MNISPNIAGPALVGPEPPVKPLSFFKALEAARKNPIAMFPLAAYEQPIWESKSIFGHTIVVSDPAGIKRVLLDNVANYPKWEMETLVLGAAFGDGLLTSDGEKWRSHRRLMAPSFDHKSLMAYAPAMMAAAEAHLERFDRAGQGATVDIAEEMTKLTLQIISQTMFSGDSDDFTDLVGDTLAKGQDELTFDLIDILPLIGPWHMRRNLDRIRKVFGRLDASMLRIIERRTRTEGAVPRDLLDRLVAARDGKSGVRLTDKEVRDEVVIIFLAGHETTAVAMTFVWYLLSQHPAEEARLHSELESVLGGRAPTQADLANLPYTRMVIEEAMRLYPPAPGISMRRPREDDEICGRRVPKTANVAIAPWILHRHRALWDDPGRFDPERFSPERSAGRPRFAYLPFGGGPRICIGAALAMMEAALILATFAQRYRLRLVPDQNIELQARVTLRPRDGIKMVLERRG